MATVRVDAWEFARPLGRGGQGEVWAGRHLPTDTPVAFKLFTQLDEAGRSAWRDEARAVAGLTHPGVIVVHDLGAVDDAAAETLGVPPGSPWLAMDLAAGSLGALPGAWTFSQLYAALDDLLAALAHVHARGVLHLDLKPPNVLRLGDRLCLADFGVARLVREGARSGQALGTPLFMAPEQVMGRDDRLGPWTDLYALGWLAWDVAAGHPWRGRTLGPVLDAQVAEAPEDPPGPDDFAAWLRRCLAKDPAERFPSAADARRALAALDDDDRPLVPPDDRTADPSVSTFTITMAPPHLAGGFDLPTTVGAAAPIPPTPPPPADWRAIEPPPAPPLAQSGLGLYRLRAVPFTGREAERDRLWQALRTVDGGRVVVLRGASGIGKTSLARWLAERAVEVGAARLHAVRCLPDGAWGHALGALCRDGLGRRPDLPDLAPRPRATLRTLAGLEHPPIPIDDRSAVTDALRDWWLANTDDRPLVVTVDDGQFAPDLLELLADLGPVPGVLVVVTVQEEALAERPAAIAALDRLAAETVALEPLDHDERTLLLDHLLGLAGDLADEVRDRTGGNPLFAVQLVGDWVDRGALVPTRHGFVLREGADARLPDGLRATWEERIDRLVRDDFDRRALERAALLDAEAGSVRIAEWRATGPVPATLRDRLLDARLAVARSEGELTLVHGMLREALLQGADAGGRLAAHHRACARAVRSPERRGRHLHAAGDTVRAVTPLLKAAGRLLNQDPRRSAVLVALAEDGLPGCTDRTAHVMHARLKAQLAQTVGDLDSCARWLDTALVHAGDDAVQRATVLSYLVLFAHRLHDLDAAAAHLAALEPLEDGLIPPLRANIWRLRGEQRLLEGELDDAAVLLRRAARVLAHAPDHRTQHGLAVNALGNLARRRGDHVEAAQRYREAVDLFRELGQVGSVVGPLAGLGDALRFDGQLDAAEEAYGELEAIAHTLGGPGRWLAAVNLGHIALARLRAAEARAHFDVVWQDLREGGMRPFVAAALWGLLAAHALDHDREGFDRVLATLRARGLAEGTDLRDTDNALCARTAAVAWRELHPDLAATCEALAAEQEA